MYTMAYIVYKESEFILKYLTLGIRTCASLQLEKANRATKNKLEKIRMNVQYLVYMYNVYVCIRSPQGR